jgi:hypothetical protein
MPILKKDKDLPPVGRVRTTEDIINFAKNLKDDNDVENIRLHVCAFYGDKCCSNSSDPEKSCTKDECVLECKNTYLSKIFSRPMEKWSPEFELPLVREKKKLQDVVEIGLHCDSCYMLDKCPAYIANSMCGIEWSDEAHTTDPKELIDLLIKIQIKRVSRASTFEEMDGGVPDANLSTEMDRLQGMIQAKNDLNTTKFSLNMSAQTNGKEGGGILAQLFGGMNKEPQLPETTNPIDVHAEIAFDEKVIEPEPATRKKL